MIAKTYDLNTLQYEVSNLLQLLETTRDQILEMDFGTGSSRNHQLDRVSSLVGIARDCTEGVCEKIERHFYEIHGRKGGVK